MRLRQLWWLTIIVRGILVPAIGLAILAILVAAPLGARPFVPALPESAPEIERVTAPWSPGGHVTGSVYDGGAYGMRHVVSGAPMTHLAGSVYESR